MHKAINFLIITKNPNLFATQQLVSEIKKQAHLVSTCSPKSLQIDHLKDANIIINRNTGLDYRDDDLDQLETFINPSKQLVTNSIKCSRILRDKYKQDQFLQGLIGPMDLIPTYELIDYKLARSEHSKQIKWIIKTRRGQQAKGIYTSKSIESDAINLIKKGDLNYIISPYFPLQREIRILMISSQTSGQTQYIAFEKLPVKEQDEFHILNFENAIVRLLSNSEIPNKIKQICGQIESSQLEFNFISVDFLQSEKKGIKLLEINSCPGLKGVTGLLAQANRANLVEQYISELVTDYNALV